MKSGGIFKNQNRNERGAINAPLLLVLLATLIAGLFTPTPTLAGVDKKVLDVCNKSTDAAFKAKYCSAAKDLGKGYIANIATSAVWTGVSVACGVACGKAIGGIACTVASSGGSVGEGVLTKKFTDSIMGEGAKWGGKAVAGTADQGTTDAGSVAQTGLAGKVNADACQTAGTSALKAYGKYSDSKTTEKSLTDLRDQTKDMNTPISQKQVMYTGDTQTSGDPNGANQSAAYASNDICSEGAIATAVGAIRCAASRDPSLPPYVKSEEFLKDLQKATGKSADAFFANFERPAKSIFDSPLAAGLPESQQKSLADSLSAMEGYSNSKAATKVASAGTPGGYDSVGGVKHSADDNTGFDMNGMIAGILGQAGGAADGENDAAASAGEHIGTNRRPAGNIHAAEDRSISIFDRVQTRYGAISARDRLGAP